MKREYLTQAWLVILLSLCFGAALAGIQMALAERIESNKLNETLSQIPLLVPGSEGGERVIVSGRLVYRATAGGNHVGWVIPASGQGFAAAIEVLVGVDSRAETITGLYVLEQRETPGLGNKITDQQWRSQFKGKMTGVPLRPSLASQVAEAEIRAITGATISSESVCNIVNRTLSELREALVLKLSENEEVDD